MGVINHYNTYNNRKAGTRMGKGTILVSTPWGTSDWTNNYFSDLLEREWSEAFRNGIPAVYSEHPRNSNPCGEVPLFGDYKNHSNPYFGLSPIQQRGYRPLHSNYHSNYLSNYHSNYHSINGQISSVIHLPEDPMPSKKMPKRKGGVVNHYNHYIDRVRTGGKFAAPDDTQKWVEDMVINNMDASSCLQIDDVVSSVAYAMKILRSGVLHGKEMSGVDLASGPDRTSIIRMGEEDGGD